MAYRLTTPRFLLAALLTTMITSAVPGLRAHEMTYQGTVLTVESARIEVKTIDATSKKEQDLWFAVNRATKVKRGDKPVTYAGAALVKGERIAVIVDHDAETKMLATEIRLAAKK